MSKIETKTSRRSFIKSVGAVGAGSMLASLAPMVDAADKNSSKKTDLQTLPTRPFGKTGVNVSILSLGGVLGMSDLIVFRQAMKMGVTYWDTADGYGWGKMRRPSANTLPNFQKTEKKSF